MTFDFMKALLCSVCFCGVVSASDPSCETMSSAQTSYQGDNPLGMCQVMNKKDPMKAILDEISHIERKNSVDLILSKDCSAFSVYSAAFNKEIDKTPLVIEEDFSTILKKRKSDFNELTLEYKEDTSSKANLWQSLIEDLKELEIKELSSSGAGGDTHNLEELGRFYSDWSDFGAAAGAEDEKAELSHCVIL